MLGSLILGPFAGAHIYAAGILHQPALGRNLPVAGERRAITL
jgi:hypothetical protein